MPHPPSAYNHVLRDFGFTRVGAMDFAKQKAMVERLLPDPKRRERFLIEAGDKPTTFTLDVVDWDEPRLVQEEARLWANIVLYKRCGYHTHMFEVEWRTIVWYLAKARGRKNADLEVFKTAVERLEKQEGEEFATDLAVAKRRLEAYQKEKRIV
jgi:hypothetical protein